MTTSRPAVRVIDVATLRTARIRCGWSETALAAHLGVSPAAIFRLEHGADQRSLDLAFVAELARSVGMALSDLLTDDHRRPVEYDPDPDKIGNDDVARVGAALADHGEMVCIDTLAATLGWTLERTLVAIDHLEALLATVGQGLAWMGDAYVCVAPARRNADCAEGLSRRSVTQAGLNSDEALLLWRVATEGPLHRPADLNRWALGRLQAAGLVDTHVLPDGADKPSGQTAEGTRLTDEARFSLVL